MSKYTQDLGGGVKLVVERDPEARGFVMWQTIVNGESGDSGANLYSEHVDDADGADAAQIEQAVGGFQNPLAGLALVVCGVSRHRHLLARRHRASCTS